MVDIELIIPQMLPLNELELNTGQIPDVPENPRFIRDDRYKKLKESITRHPEMMGYREIWVFPFEGKNVIIGGNQRYRALKELKYTHAPCKVLPPDTSAEDLRHYILLDNAEFGEDDTDILANQFEVEDLELAGLQFDFDTLLTEDDFNLDKEEKDMGEYFQISLPLRIEFKDKIMKWLRNGGREQVINYIEENA